MNSTQPRSESADAQSVIDDARRLSTISRLELVDTSAEEEFDRLTRLAAAFIRVPVSLVSIVTDEKQFFKSATGLPEPWATCRSTPLSHSFCQHVVGSGQPLIINDARNSELLRDNLAIRDLQVIAYLGFPLVLNDGTRLGSFCVIESQPRNWTEQEISVVGDLASLANSELNLRNQILIHRGSEKLLAGKALELAEAHEFLSTVLSSLESAICIAGVDLEVVESNLAWRALRDRFLGNRVPSEPQLALAKTCEPAENCMTIFGAACNLNPELLESIELGIRNVVRGAQPDFHCEYNGRVEGSMRWFDLRATAVARRGSWSGGFVPDGHYGPCSNAGTAQGEIGRERIVVACRKACR